MTNSPFDGMSRREFLARVTAAGGSAVLAAWAGPIIEKAYAAPVRSGSLNSIEHIVLFMQENHSFDHYFGTRYAVNGFGDDPDNPPPIFKQRGWAPSPTEGGPTDWNDPSKYTLPFRLNTTRGPMFRDQAVSPGLSAWAIGSPAWWSPRSVAADESTPPSTTTPRSRASSKPGSRFGYPTFPTDVGGAGSPGT